MTFDPDRIREVNRIELKPGEILLFKMERPTAEQADLLHQVLPDEWFGRVVIVDSSVEITVASAGEEEE